MHQPPRQHHRRQQQQPEGLVAPEDLALLLAPRLGGRLLAMRFDAGFHHVPTPEPALAYANTGCPRISIGERPIKGISLSRIDFPPPLCRP